MTHWHIKEDGAIRMNVNYPNMPEMYHSKLAAKDGTRRVAACCRLSDKPTPSFEIIECNCGTTIGAGVGFTK